MIRLKHIFYGKILFYLLFLSFKLTAQVNYPTDSSFINTLSNQDKNNLQKFKYLKADTNINHFQNYYPRNSNGHFGVPSAPYNINYKVKELGFVMYNAPYQIDMISADEVKYFQTKGPYATLTGIAGTRQEQAFKMLFSNTFRNKLNITLAFNRYSGIGFFKQQQSFTNNFYTTSNYTSKNGRVGYYAYVLFNKVKHQENGGLANDSLFLENVRVTKALLPINLSNARREYRNTTADFNPWFRLNKKEDSSTVFSHFIDYRINYSGSYTKYTDDAAGTENFYSVFYLDTVATKDSSHWRSISNYMNYTLKINPINTKIKLGYKNEINQVYQYLDSTFMHQFVNAGVFVSQKDYVGYIKGSYIFSGPNKNDYSLELSNRYDLNIKTGSDTIKKSNHFYLNLKASIEKRHPDFMFNNWVSNHYSWINSFSPIDKQQALFSVSSASNRFEVGVVYQNIKNLIYFNELSVPEQTGVGIQNLSAFIRKDFLFFKHLGINTGYNYQSSSYQAIVSVPNHIINGALYYQGNLFKKALQIQVGFNAQYYSGFYGYAYQPALNQYYVQTTTQVGNYPYVDFFINARIKPVRIFVKIDHLTQGFMGHNYSLVPGYLQPDRAFKFGLNWLFFD